MKHPKDLIRLERELDAAGLLATAANPRPRVFTCADIGKLRWLDCCMRARESMPRSHPRMNAGSWQHSPCPCCILPIYLCSL